MDLQFSTIHLSFAHFRFDFDKLNPAEKIKLAICFVLGVRRGFRVPHEERMITTENESKRMAYQGVHLS
jgi:hypothetical protein